MSSWVNKTEKKIDNLATKIDNQVLQVIEGSGNAYNEEDSKEQSDRSAENTPTNNAPVSSIEEQKSSDWKQKISGIFKIKKG